MQRWASEGRKHQPWNALLRIDMEPVVEENQGEGCESDKWSMAAEYGSDRGLDDR